MTSATENNDKYHKINEYYQLIDVPIGTSNDVIKEICEKLFEAYKIGLVNCTNSNSNNHYWNKIAKLNEAYNYFNTTDHETQMQHLYKIKEILEEKLNELLYKQQIAVENLKNLKNVVQSIVADLDKYK